jgi:hypothetical protein
MKCLVGIDQKCFRDARPGPAPKRYFSRVRTNITDTRVLLAGIAAVARPDDVNDRNQIKLDTGLAEGTPRYIFPRYAATIKSSVFNAVNAIERYFTPMYVSRNGGSKASRHTAAVMPAYVSLVNVYPAHLILPK